MGRDILTYLGIEAGPQFNLVLAWSPSGDLRNIWMLAIRAFERLVGSRTVQDYRVAVDPDRSFAYILCPVHVDVQNLRARYVKVGDIKFFFELVRSVQVLPFYDDTNQHPRATSWV